MSTELLLLVAGCALGWAILDSLRKVLMQHLTALPLIFFLTLGQVPVLAAWWMHQGGGGPPGLDYAGWALASIGLNLGANVAFMEAVKRSPLSLTIPLLSLTPALTAAIAVPMLGELPSLLQWTGIALVVAGAIDLSGGGAFRELGLRRALTREPGVPLMLGVAAAWSLTLPIDKLAVAKVGAPLHAVILCAGIAGGTLALLAGRGNLVALRVPRPAALTLAFAIVVGAAALGTQLLAIPLAMVGLVETAKRAIGNGMALLLGALLFHEQVTLRRAVDLSVMVAGVALILS